MRSPRKQSYNHKEDRLHLKLVECLNNIEKKDLFSPADCKSDRSLPTYCC